MPTFELPGTLHGPHFGSDRPSYRTCENPFACKITSFFVVPIDYNTKNTVIQSTFSKFLEESRLFNRAGSAVFSTAMQRNGQTPASEPQRIRLYETNSKCCKFSSFDFQLPLSPHNAGHQIRPVRFPERSFRCAHSPRSDFRIRQRCSYGSACLHSAVPSLACKRNLQPKFLVMGRRIQSEDCNDPVR